MERVLVFIGTLLLYPIRRTGLEKKNRKIAEKAVDF